MQIFFARIPNTIVEDELKEVFSQAGSVKEVVLFKTHATATVNKACLPSTRRDCNLSLIPHVIGS